MRWFIVPWVTVNAGPVGVLREPKYVRLYYEGAFPGAHGWAATDFDTYALVQIHGDCESCTAFAAHMAAQPDVDEVL